MERVEPGKMPEVRGDEEFTMAGSEIRKDGNNDRTEKRTGVAGRVGINDTEIIEGF